MVQSGSAQREPSMEEILASIRRIIEDSDSSQPPEDGGPGEEPQAPEFYHGEVAAFRAELESEPTLRAVPSMAEIQASASSPSTETQPRHSAEVKPFRVDPSVGSSAADHQFEVQEIPEVLSPVDELDVGDLDILEDLDLPQADTQPSPAQVGLVDSLPASRSSIISEQAERQVAAAFGELSEAFAASRRRSFDEMAEEMLRPMLQDWLDNNLPTLVEKLVREEIERIARGGQA